MSGVSDQPPPAVGLSELYTGQLQTVADHLAPLYTVDDIAERYDLSKDRLYDLLKAGDLVGFKVGRAWMVHADDWNAYIDSLRSAAADR